MPYLMDRIYLKDRAQVVEVGLMTVCSAMVVYTRGACRIHNSYASTTTIKLQQLNLNAVLNISSF